MEGKLGGALADMEIELRKCSVDDNGTVGLHHIFEQVKNNFFLVTVSCYILKRFFSLATRVEDGLCSG